MLRVPGTLAIVDFGAILKFGKLSALGTTSASGSGAIFFDFLFAKGLRIEVLDGEVLLTLIFEVPLMILSSSVFFFSMSMMS